MFSYSGLDPDLQLNQIVMAGSHDAGITGGGKNAKTQDMDIRGQALFGARVFDLRVTAGAVASTHGQGKEVKLMAFHADPKVMKNEQKERYVRDLKRTEIITRTKLDGGAFGMGLKRMLHQARSFVEDYPTEFLILKFDKCQNWGLIADACVNILGDTLLEGRWNLNTARLWQLARRVIVLFTPDGLAAPGVEGYTNGGGILGVKNLFPRGGYDDEYNGLQYYGKGGTDPFKPLGKYGQNKKKQRRRMRRGAEGDPNVMGMMYWTTTGIFESIRKRDIGMWGGKKRGKLQTMWQGLTESIEERLPDNIDAESYSAGPDLTKFMPNIVMIDFADEWKCRQIYDLNGVPATQLTEAFREANGEE
jgi:hypothetical protein